MNNAIDVIIPTHNQADHTVRCLQSIAADEATRNDVRVIWIDNGSDIAEIDKVRDALASVALRVHPVIVAENTGFVRAVNMGLAIFLHGDAEFVVIGNNDTVYFPNTLVELRRALAIHRSGIAGPVSTSGWQHWNQLGGHLGNVTMNLLESCKTPSAIASVLFNRHAGEFVAVRSMMAFFCAMMRRQLVVQIGCLDERFGQGFGDDDQYCDRVRRAGFALYLALGAFVEHAHRTTFRALYTQNQIRDMQEKNTRILEDWRLETRARG